jgi:hypothetical protein
MDRINEIKNWLKDNYSWCDRISLDLVVWDGTDTQFDDDGSLAIYRTTLTRDEFDAVRDLIDELN